MICSAACPRSRRWERTTCSGRRGRGAAQLRPPGGDLPRGRRQRHVLHRPHRPRARGPRAPGRPHDHARAASAPATSSASWRCSTTSSARRPSSASRTPRPSAILGTDMRRLMREHPDIAPKLVISLGRRLREANERLARQSFQTVQSRVAVVLSELVEQAGDGARADARDVLLRDHAGGHRPARRLLARVREPLPGDARARRRPRRRAAGGSRPRPRRARRLRVLTCRPPGAARPSASSRPAASSSATGRAATRVRRDRAVAPRRRAASKVLALPKGHPDGGETPAQAALREVREETGRRRRASSSASATCATGTSATAGGSPRSSPSSCSSTSPATPSAMRRRGRARRAGCRSSRPRGS